MPSPSLPDECFSNIFSFLDNKSLYKCLFVNRYHCKLSIPTLWKNPFEIHSRPKASLVNTLLACLNAFEISSLIPYTININSQSSLFEYGKFIRKIDHDDIIMNIIAWLKYSDEKGLSIEEDYRIQKLASVIYHMIFRQGCNIQQFDLIIPLDVTYIDFPKFSIFTTHKPGITNLKSLHMHINLNLFKYKNTIEFLNMAPKFCSNIQIFESNGEFIDPFLGVIKLQPLKKIILRHDHLGKDGIKKLLYALKHRSKTLKELSFNSFDFQNIDLSLISELECLDQLNFSNCCGFTSENFENSSKKLHLKELTLWYNSNINPDIVEAKINLFCNKALLKLTLNIITLETVIAIEKTCLNIGFLHIEVTSGKLFNLTIPRICELASLKILYIKAKVDRTDSLVNILANCLISVEYLSLDFHINLPNFEYFTNNCIANLKMWNISVNAGSELRKDYLRCVENYQRAHNSLKVLGLKDYDISWTREELKFINSLKNLGVLVVSKGIELKNFHQININNIQ